MKSKVIEASAGDGKVTAVVNGNRELIALNIDPSVVNAENPELLENLIISAVNMALNNVREMVNHEMNKATGGFSIPGLM
jgi:DNA-binding YbaB/EbfC family protein